MQILNFLLNLDPSVYVLFIGGAVSVSLLTQWAKRLFDLTNEKHVVAVFNLIALIASGLDYFLSNSHLPPYILGVNTLILTGLAQPIYIYAIKPLSMFVTNVNLYKDRVLGKVNDIAADMPLNETTSTKTTTVTTPASAVTTTVVNAVPVAASIATVASAVPTGLPVVETAPVASF